MLSSTCVIHKHLRIDFHCRHTCARNLDKSRDSREAGECLCARPEFFTFDCMCVAFRVKINCDRAHTFYVRAINLTHTDLDNKVSSTIVSNKFIQ